MTPSIAKRWLTGLVWGLMCLAWWPPSVQALDLSVDQQVMLVAQADKGVSAERAAAIARKRTGGQVLSVKTRTRGNRRVHRVKVLLPGGRVKVVELPAK